MSIMGKFPAQIYIYVFKMITKLTLSTACRRFQGFSCVDSSSSYNSMPFPDYLNP